MDLIILFLFFPKTFKSLGFPIILLWATWKIIPKTCRAHYIRYLFLLQNFMLVDLAIRYHLKSQYFQTHAHWRGFHRSSHYSTFYLHSLIVTTYLNQGLYYSHNLYRQWTRKCETPHECFTLSVLFSVNAVMLIGWHDHWIHAKLMIQAKMIFKIFFLVKIGLICIFVNIQVKITSFMKINLQTYQTTH